MAKVSKEVALQEFERLAAAADVDVDTSNMDEEDAESTEETREYFCKAIQAGRLTVDENGRAVLITSDGTSMTFRIPRGKDLMILGDAKEDRQVQAVANFVCSLTGLDSRTVGELAKGDWKLAFRLAGFLAAD